MRSGRKVFGQAGSILSLPFLFLMLLLPTHATAGEQKVMTFQRFDSSCIDLGHYDRKGRLLTVRFAGDNLDRFYRYAEVPLEIWEKLNQLNEQGGVGEYLNETMLRHPNKFPFREITLNAFKVKNEKKKAGGSR